MQQPFSLMRPGVIAAGLYSVNQERLGVLAAPRRVRSTFPVARLRSAVPKHA